MGRAQTSIERRSRRLGRPCGSAWFVSTTFQNNFQNCGDFNLQTLADGPSILKKSTSQSGDSDSLAPAAVSPRLWAMQGCAGPAAGRATVLERRACPNVLKSAPPAPPPRRRQHCKHLKFAPTLVPASTFPLLRGCRATNLKVPAILPQRRKPKTGLKIVARHLQRTDPETPLKSAFLCPNQNWSRIRELICGAHRLVVPLHYIWGLLACVSSLVASSSLDSTMGDVEVLPFHPRRGRPGVFGVATAICSFGFRS